jgi:predicted nucleic acid-binding protein
MGDGPGDRGTGRREVSSRGVEQRIAAPTAGPNAPTPANAPPGGSPRSALRPPDAPGGSLPPAVGGSLPPGGDRRRVVLDANVIEQINRGNDAAATRLRELVATADVYISQRAHVESVVDPKIPRTEVAKRLVLDELGIGVAPPGSLAERTVVYERNITVARSGYGPLEPKDVLTAAQARAINAEVWSFDKSYRKNFVSIERNIGVRVAPESHGIPLARGAEDYRVGRRLLGLAPVDISLSGVVTRPGGGRPPGGGGPPSGTGAGLPSGGTPPPGGGAAGGALLQALFVAVGYILTTIGDEIQRRDADKAFSAYAPSIASFLESNPEVGALIVFQFTQQVSNPSGEASYIQPGLQFRSVEAYYGRSEREAEAAWNRTWTVDPERTRHVATRHSKQWIAPRRAALPGGSPKPEPHPATTVALMREIRVDLKPPPNYRRVFHHLNGSSMLQMLDALAQLRGTSQLVELSANFEEAQGVDRARIRVAIRAAQLRGVSQALAIFLMDDQNRLDLSGLEPEGRRAIEQALAGRAGRE